MRKYAAAGKAGVSAIHFNGHEPSCRVRASALSMASRNPGAILQFLNGPGNSDAKTAHGNSLADGFINRHARNWVAVGFLFRRVHSVRL